MEPKTAGRTTNANPFAETTEQLGGYYLIDVDNLEEAIATAGSIPPAKKGTVEIQPFVSIACPVGRMSRN